MATLNAFSPPADQIDFPNNKQQQSELDELWSTNVEAFTQQAIFGDPWNETGASNQSSYYNPLTTDIPDGTAAAPINWFAFPGRMDQYLGPDASPPNPYNYTQEQLWELADTGQQGGQPLPEIPVTLCPLPNWGGTLQPYGPYGPRGWQDEYSEWSVTRNVSGQIIRVDFTCENPEYWYSLWRISPETAASIYQDTLNAGLPTNQQITVSVEDLQLVDPQTGQPVIDPSTGLAAYNPLNKWNSGPVSTRTGSSTASGGAMHLTATPNTLQTELGLAGGATVLRTIGNQDPQALICCSQYGQPFRHSDPHIGQGVNQLVSAGYEVALANPSGLYIQMPDFSTYALPPGNTGRVVRDCWHIIRGSEWLIDPVTQQRFPGNFILHAAFEVPEEWGFTVSDITIGGQAIQYGAQIAETFQMALYGRPIAATAPPAQACVAAPSVILVQPLQLMFANLWQAYYGTSVPNVVGYPMSLASNTVIMPPVVEQGATGVQLALTCSGVVPGPSNQPPQVSFPSSSGDVDITVTAVAGPTAITYAVPGNSYPSQNQLLTFTINVAPDAQLGLREILVTNYGGPDGVAGPGFLNVVAPTTPGIGNQ
jgi:hypothetical protein